MGLGIAAALVLADRSEAMRAAIGGGQSMGYTASSCSGWCCTSSYRFVGVFAAGTAVDFLEDTVFGSYITPP